MRRRIYRKAHRTLKPPISKQHKAKTKNQNPPHMLCGSKLRAALSSHLRRNSSAFSLPLRRFSSTVTAAATATMASNHHPKDESYLNQVIPKRIQLFQSIQAKLLTERLSLSSDPIKYISPKKP